MISNQRFSIPALWEHWNQIVVFGTGQMRVFNIQNQVWLREWGPAGLQEDEGNNPAPHCCSNVAAHGGRLLLSSSGDFMGSWLSPQFCRGNAGRGEHYKWALPGVSKRQMWREMGVRGTVNRRRHWTELWNTIDPRAFSHSSPSHPQLLAPTKTLLGKQNPFQGTDTQV